MGREIADHLTQFSGVKTMPEFKPELESVTFSFKLVFPVRNIEFLMTAIDERLCRDDPYRNSSIYEGLCGEVETALKGVGDPKEWCAYGDITVDVYAESPHNEAAIAEAIRLASKRFWNKLKRYKEAKEMLAKSN